MIYLFYGDDKYGVKKAIRKLEEATKEAEVIKMEKPELEDIHSVLASSSFFATRRLVVISGLLENLRSSNTAKDILAKLNIADEGTTIALVEDNKPNKKVLDVLAAAVKAKEFQEPKEGNLVSFIKEKAQEEGMEISPLAAERLATFVGADYWQLEEEIKKLALYKMDDPTESGIQTGDVDELVHANFEANIFELMDAISEKNQRKALGLLNSFLDSGENEIYLLTMIARQFRNIAMAKFEPNISEASLAKQAGLHPFVAKKSIAQARNFEKAELVLIQKKIAKADLDLKSSQNAKMVLAGILI